MIRLLISEEPVVASAETGEEFEIVMGRRQMASASLVVLVLVAVFSGASYVAGRATVPQAAPPPPPPVAVPAPEPVIPIYEATVVPAAPLRADPAAGATYLQLGALDEGFALVMAEGLRQHGLTAFIAPGPSERIFRVLVGPLADNDAYKQAKGTVDGLGLSAFARKYQQ